MKRSIFKCVYLPVVLLFFCGCANMPVVGVSHQEVDSLKAQVARLEALIADRDKELAAVREVLRQKELRIDQMRRQLESVGIFGG